MIPKNQNIPPMMNAVRLHSDSGPAGLVYEQIPTPKPKPGETLVRGRAAALTRDELTWPVGRLPAIPSYEFSGVVAASQAAHLEIGREVYALSAFDRDGAAADYIAVSDLLLAPKPKALDYLQSACAPLAALTAWQALFDHGGLAKGQRALIHGATGGVGTFAVQLAKLHGAYVYGTVSSRNVDAARQLGLDEVIDHTRQRFEDLVRDADLVLDTAGGERLERSPSVIRKGGRLVCVASEPSQEAAARRGIQAVYFVVKPNGGQLAEITKLIDGGKLKPVVGEVFPLAQARQAFERLQGEHPAGKIVLKVGEE